MTDPAAPDHQFAPTPQDAPAAEQAPAAGAGGAVPGPGDTAFVQVSVATLWGKPRLNRPGTDDPSLSTPADPDAWNANMDETETLRWLTGNLETQGVLGSRVIVDEIDGEWARVVLVGQPDPSDPRGYPGWVPLGQIVMDPRFEALADSAPTATVTARRARLTQDAAGEQPGIEVSFDTVLPVVATGEETVEVAVPGAGTQHLPAADVVVRQHGEAPPVPTVEDVVATGERFLGLRYLWSGVSAWGYDCSGFTYTMFHHHGITIPRDAGPQLRRSGLRHVEREDLRRGDLVFFAEEPGAEGIAHVAMYVGDDQIMHAPNAPRSISVESLTEYDTAGKYAGAVRVID